jgi:phosphoribosylamine--glycine ligase
MKVLVIGSGGREHCLVWEISKSKLVDKIYAIPGNVGMEKLAECLSMDISSSNFDDILKFVEDKKIDLTVVGPETPLVNGIVDNFKSRGFKIFGPDRKASMLEGSKVFTKELLQKYNIPTPDGIFFKKEDYEDAVYFLKKKGEDKFPVVVKADGLAAGKGVIIAENKEQAIEAVKDCFVRNKFGGSGDRIIIEDFLSGFEVSILCLCDGNNITPMVLAQDYKKIYEGDKGKNTGGMGSYSPVPFVNKGIYEKILSKIMHPAYDALIKEDIRYQGVLYGGLIIADNEPYLLEYNCRFGDPETQATLPRLKEDLVPLLIGCVDGSLGKKKLIWDTGKCVCVVIASNGYPESSSSGDIIVGLDSLNKSDDIDIFHAGTKKSNENIVTNGGRVLGVVSKADSFKECRQKVYSAIENIKFNGMQYRRDIALRAEGMDQNEL